MSHRVSLASLVIFSLLGLSACEQDIHPNDMAAIESERVEVAFNYPGSRQVNGTDTEADDILVQLIDRANASIDFAVMGFSRHSIIDALLRAFHRGVSLRFVGNARHMFGNVRGYRELDRLNVPMQVGNQNHIMHDKFFIIDRRFVVTGTGNITSTGYGRNDNNWVLIDSPEVALDFQAEFDQMFGGRFGYAKKNLQNKNRYQVGDTNVEVHFSPQEDAMGRILEVVENAKETVEFFIFAFTKDQLGSLFIAKHREFERYNRCCDPDRTGALSREDADACLAEVTCVEPYRPRYVRGVIDRSQLHSNGPYHEVYRLLAFGVPVRMDGNDNSRQPGDYQAGGGRQHSKTMVIDGYTDNPTVLTGSFNWSASATVANDETLLVLEGRRMGQQYAEYFDYLWSMGKNLGNRWVGDSTTLKSGDIIFNEIQWDGYNGLLDPSETDDPNSNRYYHYVFNDEFIELLNTRPDDFIMGLYPGTIIGPYERFLIVDHNTEPYDDVEPQMMGGAYCEPNFVLNNANDARFLRLNLRNARFRIQLIDPRGTVIDRAGDGTAPFFGGRERLEGERHPRNQRVFSMERVHSECAADDAECTAIGDGQRRESWRACSSPSVASVQQIRPERRDNVVATPGQPNSVYSAFPAEPAAWRHPISEGFQACPPPEGP